MKEYLKNINKSYLQLKIDSFIEDKFIDIIEAAKLGKTNCVIEIDKEINKDLLSHVEIIKEEFKYIFDDCKVYLLQNETKTYIIIDWS